MRAVVPREAVSRSATAHPRGVLPHTPKRQERDSRLEQIRRQYATAAFVERVSTATETKDALAHREPRLGWNRCN